MGHGRGLGGNRTPPRRNVQVQPQGVGRDAVLALRWRGPGVCAHRNQGRPCVRGQLYLAPRYDAVCLCAVSGGCRRRCGTGRSSHQCVGAAQCAEERPAASTGMRLLTPSRLRFPGIGRTQALAADCLSNAAARSDPRRWGWFSPFSLPSLKAPGVVAGDR